MPQFWGGAGNPSLSPFVGAHGRGRLRRPVPASAFPLLRGRRKRPLPPLRVAKYISG